MKNKLRTYLEQSVITVHFLNYYYDITDPSNPVKKFYDDTMKIPIFIDSFNTLEIDVNKNEYKVNSGIFQYDESENSE